MVALAVLPEGCGGNGKTSCAAEGIAQIKNNMTLIAANAALARFLGRETLRVLRIMIYLHILVSSKTSGQPNPENGSQRTLDLCRTWYCRGDITSAERHTQLLINAVTGHVVFRTISINSSHGYRRSIEGDSRVEGNVAGRHRKEDWLDSLLHQPLRERPHRALD